MDTQMDEVPFFDETYYSAWRTKIKRYLKSKGVGVWEKIVAR
jgi:hypothetical protein